MSTPQFELPVSHRFVLDVRPNTLLAREGVLCASTRDGLFFWRTETGQPLQSIRDLDEGSHQGVIELDMSPDASWVATGEADLTTKVYSVASGERLKRLSKLRPEFHNAASQVRFSGDGRFLATAQGRSTIVWSVDDWREVHQLQGHTSKVHLLRVASRKADCLLISAAGKYVKVWDLETGREPFSFPAFRRMIGTLAVSATGSTLAVGGEDGLVTLWSLESGERLQEFGEHDRYVFGLAVSPTGGLIASSELDGLMCLWRAPDAATLARQTLGCAQTSFSTDGQWMVAASDTQTLLFNAHSAELLATLPENTQTLFVDDHQLASVEGNQIVLRSLRELREQVVGAAVAPSKPLRARETKKRSAAKRPTRVEQPAPAGSHYHLYVRRELKTLRLFHSKPDRKAVRPEFQDLACEECNKLDELAALERGLADGVKDPPDNLQLAMSDDGILIVSAKVRSILEEVAGEDLTCFPFGTSDIAIVWPKHIVGLPSDAPLRTGSQRQTSVLAVASPRCKSCGRPRSVTVRPSRGQYQDSQMLVGLSLEPGFWFVAHRRVGEALKEAKVTGWRAEEFDSSDYI